MTLEKARSRKESVRHQDFTDVDCKFGFLFLSAAFGSTGMIDPESLAFNPTAALPPSTLSRLVLSVSSSLLDPVIAPNASTPTDAALERLYRFLSSGGDPDRDSGGEKTPSPDKAKFPSLGVVKWCGNLRWLVGERRSSGVVLAVELSSRGLTWRIGGALISLVRGIFEARFDKAEVRLSGSTSWGSVIDTTMSDLVEATRTTVCRAPSVRPMRYATTSSMAKKMTGATTMSDSVRNKTGSHCIEGRTRR